MRTINVLRLGAVALATVTAAAVAPHADARVRLAGPVVTRPITTLPPIVLCPSPSDAQCADPAFVSKEQPAGSCAATQRAACSDHLKSRFQAAYDNAGAQKKMFRPNVPTEPWNLVTGRVSPAGGAGVGLVSASEATYAGSTLASRIALARAVLTPAGALTSYLRGAGMSDGTRIGSCREYAYKAFWDYSVFEDAAGLCRGDARCVFDAAYASGTGIAGKILKQRNGVDVLSPQITFDTERLPKNTFFAVPLSTLETSSDPARKAKIDALKARIAAGASYYGIGTGSGPNAFATGWDYHRALHDRTASVSDAEFDEYAARREALQRLVDDYERLLLAMSATPTTTPGHPLGGGLFVPTHGGDVFGDPIDWMRAVKQTEARLANVDGPQIQVGPGAVSVATHGGLVASTGVGNPGIASGIATAGGIGAGGGLVPMSGPSALTALRRQITDLLLAELDRDGRGGCLDLGASGCDWSPAAFAANLTHAYDREYEAAYRDCLDVAGPTFTVPESSRTDVPVVATWLAETKKTWRAQLASVPQYPGAPLGVVGTRRTAGNKLGDPSLFSAGYDYDIGWRIAKTGLVAGRACGFEGEAHANVHAGVTMLGYSDPSSPIEAVRKLANIVRSDTSLTVNKDAATFASRTRILDEDVYDPVPATPAPANHSWSVTAGPGGTVSSGHLSATFVIVVVPVTFEAWAEASYGATVVASTQVVDACAPSGPRKPGGLPDPKFGLDLTLEPWANVDAFGSIAVGVPGFEVGARGEVALVHVRVPMRGGATVAEKTGDPNVAVVRFDTEGNLQMKELDGKVSLFAELDLPSPLPDLDYEKELFSWSGYRQDYSLWKASSEIELGAFNTGL